MPPRDSWLSLTTLALTLLLFASPAAAQHRHEPDAGPVTPGQQHEHGQAEASLCDCPLGREGSGTSWQPDATSVHQRTFALGEWQFSAHAQISAVFADEDGPRGDGKFFSTNHVMISGRRRAGAGVFGVRTMWSLEPAMGKRGYPLLLQTGETADGVTPLVDRQHPHDLPMELAATYSRPFGADRGLYLYAAAVGTPALGPPTFMHRASAVSLPISPITHHWFDSSHVTFGVVTFGAIISAKAKIEASVFRGREPDQERWGFEKPGLDSFSFRLSVNPTPHLSLQVSGGQLEDVEQLHIFDVVRTDDAVIGVGGAASWNRVASAAREDYGGSPRAFQLFVNLSTH